MEYRAIGMASHTPGYNPPMECTAVAALRQEATMLFKELGLRRRRAREHAVVKFGRPRIACAHVQRGDFESYLQRRLAISGARIEAHILAHGCRL